MTYRSGWKLVAALGLVVWMASAAQAAEEPEPCKPVEEKSVKVEGYFSKKFNSKKREVLKEFKEIGNLRTALRAYPMGDTAKVIAIGRCVPAYMARHVMEKALKYTNGIGVLVQQAFLPSHWVSIGTTTFDEPSQQKVTEEQVKQLMDPKLSDEEFHALYRKFAEPDDLVPYFGLKKENVKKVD